MHEGEITVAKQENHIPLPSRPNKNIIVQIPKFVDIPFSKAYTGEPTETIEIEAYAIIEAAVYLVNYCVQHDVDAVFFLDKSARSTAFVFRRLWQELYPDTPYPKLRHFNVPKEFSRKPFGHRDDLVEGEEEAAEVLRKTLVHGQTRGVLPGKIAPEVLPLTGNFAVADEYVETGDTLRAGAKLLGMAFPQATILQTGLQIYNLIDVHGKEKTGVVERGEQLSQELDLHLPPEHNVFTKRNQKEQRAFLAHRRDMERLLQFVRPYLYGEDRKTAHFEDRTQYFYDVRYEKNERGDDSEGMSDEDLEKGLLPDLDWD